MTEGMDRPVAVGRWQKSLRRAAVIGAIGVLILIALAAYRQGATPTVRLPSTSITVARVSRGVYHDQILMSAKAVPRDVIYLDALEGGQVERVLVNPGDTIQLNQPLLQFRNTALELEVLDREGRLIESITQLQSYEKSLEQNRAQNEQALAKIDYEIQRLSRMVSRREVLAKKGFVPRENLEQAQDELRLQQRLRPLQFDTNQHQEALRKAQLPKIQVELSTLEQSLRVTRDKLRDLVVRAPVDGRVTAIDLKVGQNRNRGDRLAEITADTGFKLTAEVDEFYLERVRQGLHGTIDYNGRDVAVVVARVYPQVSNGRFKVDLDFAGPAPQGLLSGQTVQGRLAAGLDRKGLVLAAGPFLEHTGGAWAFVMDKNSKSAVRRPIRIGRRNTEQIEILGGLDEGDRVITSAYDGLEKIQKVQIK